MIELPIDLGVSDKEDSLECAPFEIELERVPNQTPGTIAANDILCGDSLDFVVSSSDLSDDPIPVL